MSQNDISETVSGDVDRPDEESPEQGTEPVDPKTVEPDGTPVENPAG